jgi:hypothetical protein
VISVGTGKGGSVVLLFVAGREDRRRGTLGGVVWGEVVR